MWEHWTLSTIKSSEMKLTDIGYYNSYIKNVSIKVGKNHKPFVCNNFDEADDYSSDPWQYEVNKHCFRGRNWKFRKVPAFFGCSFTFGIGVKTPFPQIIENMYGGNAVLPNLGIPGGASLDIIKSFVTMAQLHPMSHAFISLPQIDRMFTPEVLEDKWIFSDVIPNALDKTHWKASKQRKQVEVWVGDLARAYTVDYIDWAELVAKQRGIKLYWSSWDVETDKFIKPYITNHFKWPLGDRKGRDGMHPGPVVHETVAQTIWDIING